jgi:hypothetical protein
MPACNERFGAMAAVPRRQFCGKLNVTTPQQVQWKLPLRQAAGTLSASGKSVVAKTKWKIKN